MGRVYTYLYLRKGVWDESKMERTETVWASLVAQMVKSLPATQETWVRSLGQEDPLKKGMATHSSILAWRIPWTEEHCGLPSMGSQRIGHDWATSTFTFWKRTTCCQILECPMRQTSHHWPKSNKLNLIVWWGHVLVKATSSHHFIFLPCHLLEL